MFSQKHRELNGKHLKEKTKEKKKKKEKKKTATVGLVQLVECWPQFVQKEDSTIHYSR